MAEQIIIEFVGKDKVSDVAGGITKSLGGLGTIAAGAATAGIAAAGAAVVGLGAATVGLIQDAMPLEGVQGAFEGITEAAGTSADVVLSQFKEFSGNMVTNRDAMMSFNTAAQLVGDQFALQLPEAMGYLSKVSAATGQDMGFMLDSLVKGVGRLSPMILDNLGIQVNLTEANEAYAAQLGKSVEEMTKSEQQTALMNQVMQLLGQNTAAMPEVTGTAAAAWGSFQATLQDTKDTIGLALLPVVTPLLEAFSSLAAQILPPLANFITSVLIPAITSLVEWFKAEVLPRLKETGQMLRETLGPAFKELWSAIQQVAAALGGATGDVDALDIILAVLTVSLKLIVPIAKGVALVFEGIASGVRAIAKAIDFVISKFEDFKEMAKAAASAVPSWLIPGSPTPFETGLRGIGAALSDVNTQFGGVTVGGGPGLAGAGGGFSGPIVVNLNYSPAVSLGDRYEAESRLAPMIAGAVRRELETRGAI